MMQRKTTFNYNYYNQVTTNLAFHSKETLWDKLSNWLSFIAIQVHAKLHKNFISTSSLHWNIKE